MQYLVKSILQLIAEENLLLESETNQYIIATAAKETKRGESELR